VPPWVGAVDAIGMSLSQSRLLVGASPKERQGAHRDRRAPPRATEKTRVALRAQSIGCGSRCCSAISVLPDPKIHAGCNEFPPRHRHGVGFRDPSAESLTSEINVATDGAATGCNRWLMVFTSIARPVISRQKKGFSADIGRCTQNTRMLRCGSRTAVPRFRSGGADCRIWAAGRAAGPSPFACSACSALKLLLCNAAGRWRGHSEGPAA
jgi:hypothetical protein